VVVAVVLGAGSSPPPTAGDASSASGTTTVERRDLVESDTESGTLSYANPQTVYNRLSGTIAWLPSVGRVIKPGQPLFRVGSVPVILMNGSIPAYRNLGPSDSDGQDILELNRNLVELGFNSDGIVIDDAWQAATTAGVDVLQASLGQTETGMLELGQVVFLPGDQIVSTVSAQLGSAAALGTSDPRPEFVSLTTTTGTTPAPTAMATQPQKSGEAEQPKAPTTLAALIALLKAETAQLKAAEAQLRAAQKSPSRSPNSGSPSSSNHGNGNKGNGNKGNRNPGNGNPGGGSPAGADSSGGGSASAVLQTTSTKLVATAQLDPSKQREAKLGEHVTVEMPSGKTVSGRVSAVSPVAQSSNNTGSSNGGGGNGGNTGSGNSASTIPVTITLKAHQSGAGLDQASVSVNFVQARANNVLSVPVTALLATQGGGYALQEALAPHRLIRVTPGLFAAGYVEISGPGAYPGLEVTDSQG
jgi:hypothetical protein